VKTEVVAGFMSALRVGERDTLSAFGDKEEPCCRKMVITLFVPKDFHPLIASDDETRSDVCEPTHELSLPFAMTEARLTPYTRGFTGPGLGRGIAIAFTRI